MYKRNYKDTQKQCEEQGFTFQPLVVEAHGGGWSKALRLVVAEVARRQRTVGTSSADEPALRIAQRISISITAENARAVLRRAPQGEEAACGVAGWGGYVAAEDYGGESPDSEPDAGC